MLQMKEAERIFKKESIMVRDRDVMPIERAAELTSDEAVGFAKGIENGLYYNGFGVGDYTMYYLTEKGFYIALTYCNIREYQKIYGEGGKE